MDMMLNGNLSSFDDGYDSDVEILDDYEFKINRNANNGNKHVFGNGNEIERNRNGVNQGNSTYSVGGSNSGNLGSGATSIGDAFSGFCDAKKGNSNGKHLKHLEHNGNGNGFKHDTSNRSMASLRRNHEGRIGIEFPNGMHGSGNGSTRARRFSSPNGALVVQANEGRKKNSKHTRFLSNNILSLLYGQDEEEEDEEEDKEKHMELAIQQNDERLQFESLECTLNGMPIPGPKSTKENKTAHMGMLTSNENNEKSVGNGMGMNMESSNWHSNDWQGSFSHFGQRSSSNCGQISILQNPSSNCDMMGKSIAAKSGDRAIKMENGVGNWQVSKSHSNSHSNINSSMLDQLHNQNQKKDSNSSGNGNGDGFPSLLDYLNWQRINKESGKWIQETENRIEMLQNARRNGSNGSNGYNGMISSNGSNGMISSNGSNGNNGMIGNGNMGNMCQRRNGSNDSNGNNRMITSNGSTGNNGMIANGNSNMIGNVCQQQSYSGYWNNGYLANGNGSNETNSNSNPFDYDGFE